MNGLQGCARTGLSVFQTTSNWPLACTSPISTGFQRWWLVSSIFRVKPEGAAEACPLIALRTSSTLIDPAFFTACAHMWMPTYVASIGSLVTRESPPGSLCFFTYAFHFLMNSVLAGFFTDMK